MSDRSIRDVISKNLQIYRKQCGLTQRQLAEMLGVRNSAISNWETGANSIDIDTLVRACEIFGTTINDMYEAQSNTSVTTAELIHIQKYRTLDEYGRKNVDTVLENEYARCNETKTIPLCKTTDSCNIYEDKNHGDIINYSESLTGSLVAEPSDFYSVHTLAAHERKDATEEGKQSDYDLIRKIKENNGGGGAKRE